MSILFFDLDGTLIDSAIGITRCVAYALEKSGEPIPPEHELRRWIGPPLRDSFGPLLNDVEKTEAAVAFYRERFETDGWAEHEVYDGIPGVIGTLAQRGHRLAVVTAKNDSHARKIIEHLPFGHHFEMISGASLDGRISYKSQLIQIAMETMQVPAEDCVMIGDRYMDIEGAQHHQITSVGVLWGFGGMEELSRVNPTHLIDKPEQLLALFQ
ncbi:MAG: HAD hydrolase-like protein [Methylococcales bacterium]